MIKVGVCQSLVELVELSQTETDFKLLIWSLVDYLRFLYKKGDLNGIKEILKSTPPLMGNSLMDRYLAAIIESLYLEFQLDLPDWLNDTERVEGEEEYPVAKKFIPLDFLEELRSITPEPFRRRKIFYSDNVMSRC